MKIQSYVDHCAAGATLQLLQSQPFAAVQFHWSDFVSIPQFYNPHWPQVDFIRQPLGVQCNRLLLWPPNLTRPQPQSSRPVHPNSCIFWAAPGCILHPQQFCCAERQFNCITPNSQLNLRFSPTLQSPPLGTESTAASWVPLLSETPGAVSIKHSQDAQTTTNWEEQSSTPDIAVRLHCLSAVCS